MDFEVRSGDINAATIAVHLRECDSAFVPPLSSRVDLDTYALKLQQHARLRSAWNGSRLLGLVATYLNTQTLQAFITNVSVIAEARGTRIARQLLRAALDDAYAHGMRMAKLQVGPNNIAARKLYNSIGFAHTGETGGCLEMTLTLQDQHA